jgi:hypothetical protein
MSPSFLTCSTTRFVLILIASLLCCLPSLAQQRKVSAPHVPVAPKLENHAKSRKPAIRQSLIGGLWMTDSNMKASLYLKNELKMDSLSVKPILYLSNGVRYALPAVSLEPSGTAIVDVNQALASEGVAPYAQLYGHAEIEYQWPWPAVSATIRNVDALNSLIFIYGLQPPHDALPQNGPQNGGPTGSSTSHNFEGFWWKQEQDVTGFLGLANLTGQAIDATVRVTDNQDAQLGSYKVTISPHGTKLLDLNELKLSTGDAGGIYLTHDGAEAGLAINGALLDKAVGYSANLGLVPSLQPASSPQPPTMAESTVAELGFMVGAADPMMNFPSGTVFTPYSLIRNISDLPASATPTLWWMAGGAPKSVKLPPITVAPHRTVNLNLPTLVTAAGLTNFNGNVNLVLDTKALDSALAMASGSVDQKNTYVFEVMPRAVEESSAKSLCYWSTGNGDDTMVTLWNPADEEQDLVFTLFYSGGHYAYPIQLGPRATRTFNLSEILQSSIPDAEGNIIPAGVHEGSAEIAGAQGENQHILVTMDVGVYNVRKAICGLQCINCSGYADYGIDLDPFGIPVGSNIQETFYGQYSSSGTKYNLTSQSNWSSSNTSLATVSTGLVQGVSPGSPSISAVLSGYEVMPGTACNVPPNIPRCRTFYPSGSTPGNVTPTISFIGGNDFIFEGSDPTVTRFNGQQVQGKPSGGTFGWGATSTSSYKPQVLFNGSSSTFSTPSGTVTVTVSGALSSSLLDTTLSVSYSDNGQSAQTPATRAITIRQFEYLVQNGAIQTIVRNGPQYGFTSYVFYNVYTHPQGQLLAAGFSGISVYEEVNLSQCNFAGSNLNTGAGSLDANSVLGDDLSILWGQALPPGLSCAADQYLGVGGFIIRHNTINWSAAGPTITNLGPTS